MIIVCLWQHKHLWVLLWFVAQEVHLSSLYIIHCYCTFCVTRRYFFHLYISNYLLGRHI